MKTALRGLYDLTEALHLFLYLDRIAYRHFIQVKNIIFVQNVNRQIWRSGVFYRYKLKEKDDSLIIRKGEQHEKSEANRENLR